MAHRRCRCAGRGGRGGGGDAGPASHRVSPLGWRLPFTAAAATSDAAATSAAAVAAMCRRRLRGRQCCRHAARGCAARRWYCTGTPDADVTFFKCGAGWRRDEVNVKACSGCDERRENCSLD